MRVLINFSIGDGAENDHVSPSYLRRQKRINAKHKRREAARRPKEDRRAARWHAKENGFPSFGLPAGWREQQQERRRIVVQYFMHGLMRSPCTK